MKRQDIVNEARKWVGVPWRHQGRTRMGVDCAGVIVKTAHTLGYSDFDTTNYTRHAQQQKLIEYFQDHMERILPQDAKPGDVMMFRDNAYPCHVGFVTKKHGVLHVLHGHATRKKVIEEPMDLWKDRWVCAFRFRGVED